ncbi:MAG: N-acetyltransferase [Thaumarchaeota archaeon]|nr:N-acetyltransferase [Nitrososphaerota archaeon]
MKGRSFWVSPRAVVGPRVKIGAGTKVWHFANVIGDDEIGRDCMIGSYVQVDPHVRIGDRTRIQPYTVVSTYTKVGEGVFIGAGVIITNARYPPGKRLWQTVIGDGVVMGSKIVTLPGITIGERAVVGSGSTVAHDVPPGEVWFGNPATFRYARSEYDRRMVEAERSAP